uniref:Uncharacterized protein n=2 Tax=Oryza rufipogon TaxID=4529 RepID=A0A0E0R280_ORYRU
MAEAKVEAKSPRGGGGWQGEASIERAVGASSFNDAPWCTPNPPELRRSGDGGAKKAAAVEDVGVALELAEDGLKELAVSPAVDTLGLMKASSRRFLSGKEGASFLLVSKGTKRLFGYCRELQATGLRFLQGERGKGGEEILEVDDDRGQKKRNQWRLASGAHGDQKVVPTPSLPQRSRHVSVTSSALLRDIHGLARRAAVLYATTVMWGAMAWVERRYDFFRLEVDEQHSEFQIVQVASNHQDGDYFFSCLELKIFSTPHWSITPRKRRGETKKSVLATAPNASCILTPLAQEGELGMTPLRPPFPLLMRASFQHFFYCLSRFASQHPVLSMGNRSRQRVAKEAMQSINEEADSPSREVQPGRHHMLKCPDGKPELHLEQIPNFHCKSLPSSRREAYQDDSIMHKRGSMYQSSSDVSRLRKLQEGRRKIDSALSRDSFMSFEIVDSSSQPSTSGPYLSRQQSRSCKPSSSIDASSKVQQATREFLSLSLRELPDEHSRLGRPRKDCNLLKDCAGDDFLEISLDEDTSKSVHTRQIEGTCSKDARSNCQHSVDVYSDGSKHGEGDLVNKLPKSLSTKVGVFDATCPPESTHGANSTTKARSSPFKKILDPIMKSKSLRNPSLMEKEDAKHSSLLVEGKSRVLRKSLLSGISRTEQSLTPNCQQSKEAQVLTVTSSPTHLHAVLKLDPTNDSFGFEFCTKGPEESIYANIWKAGNELNWIYTFHSTGKRTSTVGKTPKDRRGCLPPIVGQMHVSSYLYSEVGQNGVLNNSAISEFVLYDIAHARRSSAVERIQCTDSSKPKFCSAVNNSISRGSLERNNLMERQNNTRNNSDASTSSLWSREDLHPHLEVAAIVIQVPFHKTQSKELKDGSSSGTIKVAAAGGAHGLPRDDESSPSPLLDRLKTGGGCDCGGWDMSCPIVVLDNAYDSHWVDSVMTESKHPMELPFQGNKEALPAISMKAVGNGHFSVDFHARLSALQAFSVCICLLHCSEVSSAIGIEKFKHKLYSSSLKMLLKDEVKQLIESVTTKENKKKKTKRRKEKTPPSIVLDPPSFEPEAGVGIWQETAPFGAVSASITALVVVGLVHLLLTLVALSLILILKNIIGPGNLWIW